MDPVYHADILEKFNIIWRTGILPNVWKEATIIPILKQGKPAAQPSSYRPVSLTSCVGKVLERMVLGRLTWLLNQTNAFPPEMAGFRAKRCTADVIGDLASTLEEAKATKKNGTLCLPRHQSSFRQPTPPDYHSAATTTRDRWKDSFLHSGIPCWKINPCQSAWCCQHTSPSGPRGSTGQRVKSGTF